MKESTLIPLETIEKSIYLIRGEKVMLDRYLAELYQVTTAALNQAVRRNRERFPSDFMFQLTPSRSYPPEPITNCDRFAETSRSTFRPYAFTEQGIAMLSSVLRSKRAISAKADMMILPAHSIEQVY